MTPSAYRATVLAGAASMVVSVFSAPPALAASVYTAPLRTAVRALVVQAENNAGYDRDRFFGQWRDADGDCQDTRSEVLVQESEVPATGGCRINNGRWLSYVDNRVHRSATDVQIDHMVPVAEAWGSGARTWSQARRVSFYNDLGDTRALNAITSAVNSAKRAAGPEEWMPPHRPARCRYIAEWTAVKHRWGFSVDATERAALVRFAAACPNVTLRVTRR